MLQENQSVTIRAGRADDVAALVALEEALFDHDRISKRSFREFISSASADLLVAQAGDGRIAGYAVVLFRRTTSVARLYSIGVAPAFAGAGLGRRLVLAAEDAARARGELFMRLEVRPDNRRAIKLYRDLGYSQFGRHLAYYDDHSDALRFEKSLIGHAPESAKVVPYYRQTTDFTCGAAALLMAMAALDPDHGLSQREEFTLWREATSIYLISAPGGCDPLGVAVAAARRGFDVTVRVNQPGPFFVSGHRRKKTRAIMTAAQGHFQEEAEERDIAVIEQPLGSAELVDVLDSGAVVIVLISTYRMYRERIPHWILAYDHDRDHIFVHDPFVDDEEHEQPLGKAALAIPIAEFDAIACYGKSRLRAAIIMRSAQ